MLNVYTSPSCSSCRKVKKYFDNHNIGYVEKNIFKHKLTKDDIMKLLIASENGFEDIISTRSKIIKENNINLEEMKLHELIDFIIKNPSILKRPIILRDEEIQVGYNVDDITLFLPEEYRNCDECMNFNDCEYEKELRRQFEES